MAYAVWPATLPQYVLESGFTDQLPDQTLQTGMEAGRPKTRRRFTSGGSTITCAIAMTQSQRTTFDDFYKDTLAGGSLPFAWVHPVFQTSMNFMFRDPAPKWNVRGNAHIVAFAMEEVI